ncbi:hypothetical protein SLEP1_g22608 [Rubroshorea leprosula]|uniref:DUF4218 domain-containing protein n=1 Tax=Rubroshorea leprosula TaxID=152421 RepID=A0AAV5J9Q3_9ROSI|nr:hypothetical protein SLEP1_g22608 [Rubroshorea leprosula]
MNGFMDGYFIWKRRGEIIHRKWRCTQVGESSSAAAATATMNNVPSVNQLRDMLHDAMAPNFFNNEKSVTGVEDATQFDTSFDNLYGVSTESIFEELRGDAKEFFDLLRATDTPLFEGCDDAVTVLKWVCELMSAKTLFNMSVTNWDYVLKCSLMTFKKVDREKLPTDYYSAKKMLRHQGLKYKKKTTEHMTWHLNCYNENEKIFPPTCGEAWKHFDSTHPEFASELRNVSMEHLAIHLPYEARVGGSVQFGWMYPFERFIEIHEEVDVGEGIGEEDEEGEWEDFETSEEENIETYVEENDSSDEPSLSMMRIHLWLLPSRDRDGGQTTDCGPVVGESPRCLHIVRIGPLCALGHVLEYIQSRIKFKHALSELKAKCSKRSFQVKPPNMNLELWVRLVYLLSRPKTQFRDATDAVHS